MDADEALARQLQAEEEAAAAAAAQQMAAAGARRGVGGGSEGQARFLQLLADSSNKALVYESEMAQAMALSVMPLEQLSAAAEEACAVSAAMGEVPPLSHEDALAQELLSWFKQSFFTWVNAPPCEACRSPHTGHAGMARPTSDEASHGAGRVELYRCTACGAHTRFPRYNNPVKLLETRRGRCGEWANCFTLCCRAAGLDARLVVDLEDHVWTEQWSEAQQKWVHLDPCEASYDQPLLYEAGWGKRLSYVIAVGWNGTADVTRRYTQQYEEVRKKRTLVSEVWLEGCLREATTRLRAQLPAEERRRLEERDSLDKQYLVSGGAQLALAELAALPARTTGDAAWLAARGEDGRDGAAAQAGAGGGPPAAAGGAGGSGGTSGTRYRLAKDADLALTQPLRLCGGAVRASGENAPAEPARCAFDGSPATKWLDFGGCRRDAAWLEYRLPQEQTPAVLASYALTSANDFPERDPMHVVLEAWSDEASAWVALDERPALRFPQRHHRVELPIAGPSPALASRCFRLRVVSVANPAAANSVQLACLDLYRVDKPQQAQQQPTQQQQDQAVVEAGPKAPPAAADSSRSVRAALESQQQQGEGGAGLDGPPPPPPVQQQQAPLPGSLSAASGEQKEGEPAEPSNPWAALFSPNNEANREKSFCPRASVPRALP